MNSARRFILTRGHFILGYRSRNIENRGKRPSRPSTRLTRERPHKLDVTFELITPAVLGGADNRQGPAELRLPSIMGAIRFWWRALAWSRTTGQTDARLKQILAWQRTIFGSAGDSNTTGTGQGMVSARMHAPVMSNHTVSRPKFGYDSSDRFDRFGDDHFQRGVGLAYMAGQGFETRVRDETGNRSIWRRAVPNGKTAGIQFMVRGDAAARHVAQPFSNDIDHAPPTLSEAIWALSLLGCIGSRKTRGFGSLQIASWSIENCTPPADPESYRREVARLLEIPQRGAVDVMRREIDPNQTPYSALTARTRVVVQDLGDEYCHSSRCHSAMKSHDAAGFEFLWYRGNGDGELVGTSEKFIDTNNRQKFPGKETRGLFWSDHDLFYEYASKTSETNESGAPVRKPDIPERTIFGLPHHYYSRRTDYKMRIPSDSAQDKNGESFRRASPLRLKIIRAGDVYRAVWFSLPSRFHHASKVPIATSGRDETIDAPMPKNWDTIDDFLDALVDPHSVYPPMKGSAVEVKPRAAASDRVVS